MLVIEIIMLVAGIASYVYGNQMNNSIEMQVSYDVAFRIDGKNIYYGYGYDLAYRIE